MKPLYAIRKWEELFETCETKKIKKLSWVPIPNKHDGKGYRRILKFQDGPLVYAGWLLLVQVASKCPKRGILADDDGPLDADDLADKTGFPKEYFELAFKFLVRPEIGWLVVSNLTTKSPDVSGDTPEISGLKGREGKGSNYIPSLLAMVVEPVGPKSTPLTHEVKKSWDEAWRKSRPGHRPVMTPIEWRKAKELGAAFGNAGLPRLERMMQAFLEDQDKQIERLGHSLQNFTMSWVLNRYSERVPENETPDPVEGLDDGEETNTEDSLLKSGDPERETGQSAAAQSRP